MLYWFLNFLYAFVGFCWFDSVDYCAGDLLVIFNAVAQQRVMKGEDLNMDLLCPSQAY
jgi:hypothetical protein